MKLRILIADDHEVVRAGTRALLEQENGWMVCGTASNGEEAVALAVKLKPDVVILDLTMPRLGGIEAVRQIKQAVPKTEIIIFSAHRSERIIAEIFEAGAKSYIRKSDAAAQLLAAVRSVADHKPFFTPDISQILFARFLPRKTVSRAKAKLTPREREVARLLAEGHSNKEIASVRGVSLRTVETHRAAVLRKLHARSIADLVRYAIRNGIIEP